MSNIEVRSSFVQLAPSAGKNEYPIYDLERETLESVTGSTKSGKFSGKSQHSEKTLNSLESDRWSKRGISSRISLPDDEEIGDGGGDTAPFEDDSVEEDDGVKRCVWLHKMWGNFILPGIFGVESQRYIEKMNHKNPIAKQLVKNILKYNINIRLFFNDGLLSDMKILATQMFFPTGQIEADGLSVISAQVWAATYLLVRAHKKMREADHHSIRSAYSSLAWDSSQVYRMTLVYYQTFHQFREKFLPLWQEIESLAGIQENSDFSAGDSGLSSQRSLSTSMKPNTSKSKSGKKSGMKGNPSPLPELRISDDLKMQHSLQLKIIPEKKSALISKEDCKEKDFSDLSYARQVDVIKQLLATPGKIIQSAPITLKLMEPKLLNATYARKSKTSDNPEDFPLLRSVTILMETLKLLFKEVKITPTLRFDISENIRATAEDIHSFFAYTDWVLNKFSEFHSMLELCYNFAVLSFDLELPSFQKVSMHEKLTEENVNFSASSIEHFKNEQVEVKVVSLTKLMLEASFVSIQKQGGVDEDFEWADFYKTDYHLILQRLPLRLGYNLLQFSPKAEGRQEVHKIPNVQSQGQSLSNTPGIILRSFDHIQVQQRQNIEIEGCEQHGYCKMAEVS